MKTQQLYRYLPVAALLSFWSCSSSYQTAQRGAEVDDLYGNSGDAPVYASAANDPGSVTQRSGRQQRYNRDLYSRNTNPDYSEDQPYNANTDEYYTELNTRKLNRGLSPDPGWNDVGTNSYNSGFVNGYNAATSAYSWNRWGFNNVGLYSGLGLGLGLGGFGFGFGSPFYSPFYGSAFAYNSFYSPFGYGGYGGLGGFYDPFYGPYAYNSFYSPFYSPFGYGGYYGGGFGGFYGNPYYNNVYVTGADPYRARTYNSRYDRSAGRYNDNFSNAPRNVNPNGGRSGYTSSSNGTSSASNGNYYARPRSSGNGGYYYDNGRTGSGRSGAFNNAPSAPAYSSGSNTSSGEYYARPRQSGGGGTYNTYNGGRGGASQPSYQPQSSYQQPSYQNQSRGSYQSSQPSYSAPSRSYSSPSPSYSAPSSGGGGGGYSGGGGGGGGSRGPR